MPTRYSLHSVIWNLNAVVHTLSCLQVGDLHRMHYNWNIKYGLEWQRELEENIWQAVVRAQQESCFADLPPVGMLTFDYSAQQLTKDPNLIETAELHPYGGQHQIKGIQEFMKINPVGKKYHEHKGFHAHLYAFGNVRTKRMRDKYVQLLVSEHEKVQLFSTERSWMARFRMLRRFLLQSYADYPALLQALTECRTKAARNKIQTEICEAWQNPNPPTWPNTTINCRVCLSEQGIVDLIEELEKRWLALETLGQKKEKLKADKAKQTYFPDVGTRCEKSSSGFTLRQLLQMQRPSLDNSIFATFLFTLLLRFSI